MSGRSQGCSLYRRQPGRPVFSRKIWRTLYPGAQYRLRTRLFFQLLSGNRIWQRRLWSRVDQSAWNQAGLPQLFDTQLVEEIVRRREGVLAHLGPVVINKVEFQSADDIGVYLVKEPSSENDINWSDVVSPVEMESYHRIFDSLKDFLKDQSVYIQDCYAGSEASCRIPLRIITQDAWPNLFARHMFRHVSSEEMESFFPEYTLIHVPEFKASAGVDENISDNLILINLLKKLILIVGANSSNTIRKAVFFTLSFILPKNDMIPVRCSAIKGDDGSLSVFFGRDHALKNSLCLNTNYAFFGDDCHGWTQNDFTNIEWGCRTPVDGLDEIHGSGDIFGYAKIFNYSGKCRDQRKAAYYI